MTPSALLREVHRRDAVLSAAGWLMAAGLVVAAGALAFDTRTILGINPWIKPMKFLSSIAIFLWTLAWLAPEVDPRYARRARRVRIVVITAMVVEIVLISFQAFRGTTSHYNVATAFDAVVFQVMGGMIVANTIAVGVLLFSLRPMTDPSRAGYLRGVRLGLAIFILGSLIGFVMTTNNGHAVPGPDGGPGLPFVNWSTTMGDIRVAHFVGLHALQVLPLLGYLADRRWPASVAPARAVSALAAVWFALAGTALWIALSGAPLWRI